MSKDINNTPDKWVANVVMLTPEIGYQLEGDEVTLWHFCTATNLTFGSRWMGRSCGSHELISKDPLHLEPSLLCGEPGCPMHGYIREGQWVSA